MAVINGTNSNDYLAGTFAADTILGLDGNDTLFGRNGNDSLDGGAGNDTLDGGLYDEGGIDTLTGGAGTDVFVIPTLSVGEVAKTDIITDFVAGAAGDQIFMDSYQVGNGYPNFGAKPIADGYLRLTQTGADTLLEIDPDGPAGTGVFQTVAILRNVDKSSLVAFNFRGMEPNPILGTANAEILTVSSTVNEVYGRGGNDTISGLQGNDKLYGEDGDDSVVGGDGNDSLSGGLDDDSVDGGNGDDSLSGGLGVDTLLGGLGYDRLFGGDGNDSLDGGSDYDDLHGEQGDDTLKGGNGIDTLYGGDGNDNLNGGDGTDYLSGGNGDDSLDGGDGFDTFQGGDGNDKLLGGTDNDFLDGGNGGDLLDGGAGIDILDGGVGADTLTGGDGTDTFVISISSAGVAAEADVITDFVVGDGGDQISLTGYSPFGVSPIADGYVRLAQSGADTLLEIDADGSAGAAVFQTAVILKNVVKTSLTAFNFQGTEPNPILGTAAAGGGR
ncbi:MAG: calcium-binding protein, partial [Pseudomonadota bacterium]